MNKIDIKSFLIGILSVCCVLLFIGARNDDVTFGKIKCDSILLQSESGETMIVAGGMNITDNNGMETALMKGIIILKDKEKDAGLLLAGDGVMGSEYSLDEKIFFWLNKNQTQYGKGFGSLQLWDQNANPIIKIGISTKDNGLIDLYDRWGNVGNQLNGDGTTWNK